jgi:hypothetical protein
MKWYKFGDMIFNLDDVQYIEFIEVKTTKSKDGDGEEVCQIEPGRITIHFKYGSEYRKFVETREYFESSALLHEKLDKFVNELMEVQREFYS